MEDFITNYGVDKYNDEVQQWEDFMEQLKLDKQINNNNK